ncbi:uncharacterized protein [Dermacentor andersoni]|uniref:uncharacterized protein n=1 Tax=Dermacentor andersoni TaxID=34620 RepID=UPI0024181090|nr:uncharacterized protein LOC126524466 [Dermacentor andersoni]
MENSGLRGTLSAPMSLAGCDRESSTTTAPQLGSRCSAHGVDCAGRSTSSPPQVPCNCTPQSDEKPQPELRRTANDHANSWPVAVVGCAVIMFATGVFCTSGLFYVYFMEAFCVSREAASWPASAMGVTLNCSGLVVSLLQRFLSIFQISLLGSILLWTSLMLSAFAPNVGVMTVLFGALHGLGIGFMENTMAVTVATSFLEHQSFAMGLKDGGRTLAALVFPTIVSRLNSVYGVRSTLALCGALLMHVTALVLVLRRRPVMGRQHFGHTNTETTCGVTPRSIESRRHYKGSLHGNTSTTNVANRNYMSCKNFDRASTRQENNVVLFEMAKPIPHSQINIYAEKKDTGGTPSAPANTTLKGSMNPVQQLHGHDSTVSGTSQTPECVPGFANIFPPQAMNTPLQNNAISSLTSNVERVRRDEDKKTAFPSASKAGLLLLLTDPRFYVLVFQNTVINYSAITFRTIIVDYARDKGVPLAHAELVGTYCAATDLLVGHIALPYLSDRGFVNRTLLASLTFALLSAAMFAVTVSQGLVSFLGLFSVLSLLMAATSSFSPLLITGYLGPCRVPLTWGVSGLVTGPLLLATPVITGYFRDTMGSYDNLVRLIAGLAAISAVLILLCRITEKRC